MQCRGSTQDLANIGEVQLGPIWRRNQSLHLGSYLHELYPLEKPSCALAGGLGGAIDPKTLHKYVWPMIRHTAMLEQYLVSLLTCIDRDFVHKSNLLLDHTREQVHQ